MFAGRECSRALGKMTVDEADCSDDLTDLSEKQLQTLHDWEVKLKEKYTVVGQVGPTLSYLLMSCPCKMSPS